MTAPRRLARRVIYRNSWLNLYGDRVRLPGGRIVPRFHVLEVKEPSVACVAEDGAGRVLMVRSYRYVTGRLEWEVPAGRVDRGETPLAAARRETREESGYETRNHKLVYTFYPINGLSNKIFHVVRCRAGEKTGRPDPNEVKAVRWFSRAAVRRMIRAGRLKDGYSLAALLLTEKRRA
jgi:ADP-ribose pyrophosphatase